MKKKTISQLKQKAWALFSEWIRRRYADWRGLVSCVTCGVIKFWWQGDAGHFEEGRNNSILFDERGCHFQCKGCNGNLRIGNISRNREEIKKAYEKFMLEKYGQKVIDEIRANKKETKQFSIQELENLISELKDKISKL